MPFIRNSIWSGELSFSTIQKQVVFAYDAGAFGSLSVGWQYGITANLQVAQEFRYFKGKQTNIPVCYNFLRLKF